MSDHYDEQRERYYRENRSLFEKVREHPNSYVERERVDNLQCRIRDLEERLNVLEKLIK